MTKTDIEWLEYANEFHYGNHPEINTAVKHAIEALKKQKPVKPKVFENVGDMFFWKCPACGAEWFENHIHLYCTDCGQRFDMP